MFKRLKGNSYHIGSYSEMIAAACFTAEGYDVAFPIGSTKGWDIVVRGPEETVWQSVQVKSAIEGQRVAYAIKKGHGEGYTEASFDLLVVVHPETGTIWKIPKEKVIGNPNVKLAEEFLWRGHMDCRALPMTNESKPYVTIRREILAQDRETILANLPTDPPIWMADKAWKSIQLWARGSTYGDIADQLGNTPMAAFERVRRGLYRMGLGELPSQLQSKTARRRRSERQIEIDNEKRQAGQSAAKEQD